MLEILDRMVNWILTLLIIGSAVWVFGGDSYKFVHDSMTARKRLNFNRSDRGGIHLERMLAVVSGDRGSTRRFLLLSIIIALLTFIIIASLSGSVDLWMMLVSVGVGLLPLLFQWGRLQNLRVKGSYEAIDLITTFTNRYVLNNFNVIMALDSTVLALQNSPYSRYNIARLSKAIKMYRTPEDLQNALDDFAYAYRTDWATRFGNNIYIGVFDGLNISNSLSSLLESLKRARVLMEKNKRYNRESFMLMWGFVPLVYFGLFYYGSTLFAKSFFAILAQQFTSPMALKMFFLIVLLSCVSWVLSTIVTRPKYDL